MNIEVHPIKNKLSQSFLRIIKRTMKTMMATIRIMNKMNTSCREIQMKKIIYRMKKNKYMIII